ncbi:MAG: tetratricopeptide repeat protein [Desulfomonilaceae bacterium]|nr:tetratricopeptide repeat protein [Desulfomonilaceae bacterium]
MEKEQTRKKSSGVFRTGLFALCSILLGLLISLAVLVAVEAAFRLAGRSPVDHGEDPYVVFSGWTPLYEVRTGIASTSEYKKGLFNEVSFPAAKPAGTIRVFCFGGSTTHGRPYDAKASFTRWLEDILKASCPGRNFEVINAGGVSYASYRIVPIVRETLQYDPDLVIVYSGHNEFLERRTYARHFTEGRVLTAIRALLENLDSYRALKVAFGKAGHGGLPHTVTVDRDKAGQSGAATKEHDGKYILPEEVETILDDGEGPQVYFRDEEWSRDVVRHFAHNLNVMVRMCAEVGVPVILVDPPSNLKDFSPFKSQHGPGISPSECRELDRQLERGIKLVGQERYEQALPLLEELARKDPLYAETHYWEAKALLGLGRNDEALEHFVKACDLDVCTIRATSAIQDEVRKTASSMDNARFIPFRELVIQRARDTSDKSGVPGNEMFMDHVHISISLHQMLAELLAEEMETMGLVKRHKKLTGDELHAIYALGEADFDAHYLAVRDLNLACLLEWAGKDGEARVILERAVPYLDDNTFVHERMAEYLLDDGEHEKAIQHLKRAVELSENDPEVEYSLALAYIEAGMTDEASALLEKLSRLEEGFPLAEAELVVLLLEREEVTKAVEVSRRGLDRNPDAPALLSTHGLALFAQGKHDEGIELMKSAIAEDPADPVNYYDLACMYTAMGKTHDALESLTNAIGNGYANMAELRNGTKLAPLRTDPRFKSIIDRAS